MLSKIGEYQKDQNTQHYGQYGPCFHTKLLRGPGPNRRDGKGDSAEAFSGSAPGP
jgi:hypothetical protein